MYIRKLVLFVAIAFMALPFFLHAQDVADTVWTQMEIGGVIKYVKFLPDGQHFVDVPEGYLQLRRTSDGKILKEYKGDSLLSTPFTMTKDGKLFAGGNNGNIRIIDYETGKVVKEIKTVQTYENQNIRIVSSAFSYDGCQLALMYFAKNDNYYPNNHDTDTSFLVIYSTKDWTVEKQMFFNAPWECRIAYSPTENYLAVEQYYYIGDEQRRERGYVYLINTETWEIRQSNDFAIYSTSDIKFSPDGKKLAIGTNYIEPNAINSRALICDIPDINSKKYIYSETGGIYSLAFSKDSRYIAIGREYTSGSIEIWDLGNNRKTYTYNLKDYTMQSEYGAFARSLDVSPDNNYLLAGAGILILFNAKWNPTVVKEEINSEIVTVYPNPSAGLVTIQTDCNSSTIDYKISKATGDLILNSTAEITNNKINIDFSSYPNGVYFLTLTCGTQNTTYKVIKEG